VKELSKGAEKLGVWKGSKALFKWCKKVGGLERDFFQGAGKDFI